MGKNKDTFLHYREGKSQLQRFLKKLNPTSFELNDFDVEDWFLFAQNFAKHVNFFQKEDSTMPVGNWEAFFRGEDISITRRESAEYKVEKDNIASLIANYQTEGNLTPHLTLFICFLKLLDISKQEFNNLTKRHLDFYYSDILQIQKQDATPDSVYAVFELAKKVTQEKIPADTLLKGKADANGKTLVYKTEDDLIANQAQVVALKSFLKDEEKRQLKKADVANSLDGLGKTLNAEDNSWWPFGHNFDANSPNKKDFETLPDADLGFAVASPILDLKEGTRTITVSLDFNYSNGTEKLQDLLNIDTAQALKTYLNQNLKVLCSGEEEWLPISEIKNVSNTATSRKETLQLEFVLEKDFPAVVGYNKAVLLEKFNTQLPVLRFLITGDNRYELYEALQEKTIKNITVDVEVKEVTSLVLENDNSVLNPEKAFYPFTAQPIKDANFYIKSEEVFSKKWNTINIDINWKNAPESITDLYKGYVFDSNANNITKSVFDDLSDSVVTSDNYFKATSSILQDKEWQLKNSNIVLFDNSDGNYKTQLGITNTNTKPNTSEAIRLSLNQSALQDVYPKVYTLALTSDLSNNKIVPNEPYVPLAESITLSYTATESISISETTSNEQGQIFHEDVFGQYAVLDTSKIVPTHNHTGEFYIGLDTVPNQIVSLLIQVLEGSENPSATTFKDEEKVQWQILNGNTWQDASDYILHNDTARFLNSGIVKFKIPKAVDKTNTRVSDDLVWLRATINRDFDAVCKVAGVYTQAVLATFKDNNNELSHLEDNLEAESITKLITRGPRIKSVNQPYNSFNGTPKESDLKFYRRVSERLRHKNKAVTQWDYEQLILQQFPDVFKVKCLNHTSATSFMAPGHVTMVVIPNIKNKNAFDIYKPRVSQRTLNQIQDYVNTLNTMHVNAHVINPDYKEAKVVVDIKFYEQYDDTFYSKQLDEDIKKYISPWAFNNGEDVIFDIKLNTNLLVNYLEQLYYVDYINNIQIQVLGDDGYEPQGKTLIVSDPKSILVSAKQHDVTAVADTVCL